MVGTGADPDKWYPNPSCGLTIWGPLVPASDCKTCTASLIGLQFIGGVSLWTFPGRKPPITRSRWTNRGIKAMGALSGSYLLLYAGIETMRFFLPYDPWVEDAKIARQTLPRASSFSRLASKWFGPKGYNAVPFKEWRDRVNEHFDQAERTAMKYGNVQISFGGMGPSSTGKKQHSSSSSMPGVSASDSNKIAQMAWQTTQKLRQQNRAISENVMKQIEDNTIPPVLFPEDISDLDDELTDDDLVERIKGLDRVKLPELLWMGFDMSPIQMVLLCQSSLAESTDLESNELLSEILLFPIPQVISRKL